MTNVVYIYMQNHEWKALPSFHQYSSHHWQKSLESNIACRFFFFDLLRTRKLSIYDVMFVDETGYRFRMSSEKHIMGIVHGNLPLRACRVTRLHLGNIPTIVLLFQSLCSEKQAFTYTDKTRLVTVLLAPFPTTTHFCLCLSLTMERSGAVYCLI